MLVHPVVSNEYEIASHIIRSMLQKGLISKAEFAKIDAENKKTFIGKYPLNDLQSGPSSS